MSIMSGQHKSGYLKSEIDSPSNISNIAKERERYNGIPNKKLNYIFFEVTELKSKLFPEK